MAQSGIRFSLEEEDEWSEGDLSLEPFVIKGAASQWKAMHWTLDSLQQEVLQDNFVNKVLFGRREHLIGTVSYDEKCEFDEIDVATLKSILIDKIPFEGDTNVPLHVQTHWVYMNYAHLFSRTKLDHLDDVDFTTILGDSQEVRDLDKTLWIGSRGAHSPLHYDTMGWNLHAQLSGRKQWILVSPTTKRASRVERERRFGARRIPYEETTVYSSIDVIGSPSCLSGVDGVRVFTLSPGDVLFIPPLWWHSAICLSDQPGNDHPFDDFSISVNSWINERNDVRMTIAESFACGLYGTAVKSEMVEEPDYQEITMTDFRSFFDSVGEQLNAAADILKKEEKEGPDGEVFDVREEYEDGERPVKRMRGEEEKKNEEQRAAETLQAHILALRRRRGRRLLDQFLDQHGHLAPMKTPNTDEELAKLNETRDHLGLSFVDRRQSMSIHGPRVCQTIEEEKRDEGMYSRVIRSLLSQQNIENVVRDIFG